MIKPFFLYILLFLSHIATAQNPTSVQLHINTEPESILAHSDKQFYICGQTIWFKIYVTGQNTLKLQPLSKTAYAELTGPDGGAVSQAKIELKNGLGEGSFLIPADAGSGNYEMKVYTNRMKDNPASFFKKPISIINTLQTFDTSAFVFIAKDALNDLGTTETTAGDFNQNKAQPGQNAVFPLKVSTDKQSYSPRSPVSLNIEIANNDEAETAHVSVAVYKLNALTAPNGFMTENEINLSSSQQILHDSQVFLPEMNGFIMVARVKDAAGNPVSKVPLTVSLTGKLSNVKFGESDEKGYAYFNFKNVYGPQQILVKTTPEYEENLQIDILKSFVRPRNIEPSPKAAFKADFLEIVEEMHNNLEINRTFHSASKELFLPQNPDSVSFFGKADGIYLLDDYKRFVTMEEVLREYVREVSVRIRNKHFFVLVWNKQFSDLSRYMLVNTMMDNYPPLMLIDGVPVTADKLMKYDPLNVRKLEVLCERYFLGRSIYDGILSFTTYKGDFQDLELEKSELLTDEQGWQHQRKFFMPDYKITEVRTNRIPDFRELLYWEPQTNLSKDSSAKMSFFTSDLTGKFIVEIKGISSDGKMIQEVREIEVRE